MTKKINFNFSSPKIIYLGFSFFVFVLFAGAFIFLYLFAYQPEQQIPFLLQGQQKTALIPINYSLLQKVKKAYNQKISAPSPFSASSTPVNPFSANRLK